MNYSKIGKIQNSHGFNGAVIIKHTFNSFKNIKKLEHLFIELLPGSYIPYFIETIKEFNHQELLVKFEEVDNTEEVKKILQKDIYIEQEKLQTIKPKNVDLQFIGFEIIDSNLGKIGAITHLIEMPGQILATVIFKEKEVLIPLVEQTILNINIKQKEIITKLPDGLLEVYL